MFRRRVLAWVLLSIPISIVPTPPILADQFDVVRDFIRIRMTERQVPSIAVAVARDGKILWEEGFGWADRENWVAANEHTVYSVASITKPFTKSLSWYFATPSIARRRKLWTRSW